MKVCLLNPRIPPAPMNFQFAMDLVDCDFSHIPLQLCTVAALTPRDVEVFIVDENVEPVDLELDADVIAMTGIFSQRDRLFQLADQFRRRGKTVVIGGPITSDCPDDCREHADVLFVGEAEYTWPRFCAEFAAGENAAQYEQRAFVDMRDSPIPRFDLLKASRYSSGCVQATRGCPYSCEFCDVPQKHGNRPRSKPVERVLQEVEQLAALGFDSVFFVDDHFAGNRKYARALLTELAALVQRLRPQVYFYTQTTLNVARDEELLRLLHAASFRRVFIGIETPDLTKLRAMDKTQNTEMDMREAIARFQSYNITVWAGIILGLDGDDESTFDEQYRFIMETGITPTLIGLLQAMPGAPLYERIRREGRLRVLPGVVGSNAMGTLSAQGASNIAPLSLGMHGLMRRFSDFVRRVYEPEAYAQRVLEASARGTRCAPSVLDGLTYKNAKIIARMVHWYLRNDDLRVRQVLARVLGAAALRRGRGLEELIYHLVIYKHLRTYYFETAEITRAAALALEAT